MRMLRLMDLTFSLAEVRVQPTISGTSTCSTPLLTRTVMRAFSFTSFGGLGD